MCSLVIVAHNANGFPRSATECPTLVILSTEQSSHDASTTSLQPLLGDTVAIKLRAVHSIHVAPDSSISFAYHELKVARHETLNLIQIHKLGQILEAQWVVVIKCAQTNEKCNLSAQIIDIASNKTSNTTVASSLHWSESVSEAARTILIALSVVPTKEEQKIINRPLSFWNEALKQFAQAIADSINSKPLTTIEARLRRGLLLDPVFPMAEQALAYTLMLDGRLDDAEGEARRAIGELPDDATAHCTLGAIYGQKGMNDLARQEFNKAIILDPVWAEGYYQMGQLYNVERSWQQALSSLKRAAEIAPYDARIHASMGTSYLNVGDGIKARQEFEIADHYANSNDAAVEGEVATGYDILKDIPSAVHHYETYLGLGYNRRCPTSKR